MTSNDVIIKKNKESNNKSYSKERRSYRTEL